MWKISNRANSEMTSEEFTSSRRKRVTELLLAHASLAIFLCSGCVYQKMDNQPKYKPLRPSPFFEDGRSERPLVPGTIPRGYLRADTQFYTGKANGNTPPGSGTPSRDSLREKANERAGTPEAPDVTHFPLKITAEVLKRGQERFNIFCSVCHGRLGNGEGMVVRRGFRQPPSFHIERLREAPVGHIFDVITNGFGAMPSYSDQVSPYDRWAIIAYIRALQLSQHAALADVPFADRQKLMSGGRQP